MCICFLSFFFWLILSQFFSRFFCFPFSLPFFSLYLLPFISFLSTGNVLASALLKTWKSNIDQLGDLAYLPPTLHPKLDTFFLAFFLYTRMDGSVLAVLAAHQNNLVTSKMVQCLPTKTARKYDSRREKVNKHVMYGLYCAILFRLNRVRRAGIMCRVVPYWRLKTVEKFKMLAQNVAAYERWSHKEARLYFYLCKLQNLSISILHLKSRLLKQIH